MTSELNPSKPIANSEKSHSKGANSESAPLIIPDPFVIKTVILDGYAVRFQQSIRSTEVQIKLGDGLPADQPSPSVRAILTVPEGPHGNRLFHYNKKDKSWAMRLSKHDRPSSYHKAERVFEDVVKLVAQERGTHTER